MAEHGASALQHLESAGKGADSSLSRLGDTASGAAGGVGHLVERITSLTVVVTAAHTLESAFRGLFGTISEGVVGMNASLETATLQFTTLMGNADLAKEHVEGLFELGKESPFATGAFIEASRFLETFGGAALNTRANLVLFGDAAAATSNKMEEVAFWSGRMYAALQSGRPFGESIQRLQELAVISPKVAAALSDISEKGGDGAQAWRLFTQDLERFNGAQKDLAGTWQGLTSTFSDTLNQLIAGAGKPFFDAMKAGLSNLNTLLGSDAAAEFSANIAARFTEIIGNLGTLKDTWVATFQAFIEDGLNPIDAALYTTAEVIGVTFGVDAKKAFEDVTETVGQLAEAAKEVAGGIQALKKPLADLVGWVNAVETASTNAAIRLHQLITGETNLLSVAGEAAANVAAKVAGREGAGQPGPGELAAGAQADREFAADQRRREGAAAAAEAEAERVRKAQERAAETERARLARAAQLNAQFAAAQRGTGKDEKAPKETGEKVAETAIEGFIAGLQGGEADAAAAMNQLGTRLTTSLNQALAENSKASGQSVARSLEAIISGLREAGVEDWRAMGDALAGAVHDALIARTPETAAAAQAMIEQMSRAVDEAQFWQQWAEKGKEAGDRINVAMQTTAEKITKAWEDAQRRMQEVWDNLDLQKKLEEGRKAVEDAVAFLKGEQDKQSRRTQDERQERDTASQRLREDADAQTAHERRLAELRKTLKGEELGKAIRDENAAYSRQRSDAAEQRARQDADRRQQRSDRDADLVREAGNRRNIEGTTKSVSEAYGITPEQQREQAAQRQIAEINRTSQAAVAQLRTDLATAMDNERTKMEQFYDSLVKKYPQLFPVPRPDFSSAGEGGTALPNEAAGTQLSQPVGAWGGAPGYGRQLTIQNNGIIVDAPKLVDVVTDGQMDDEQTNVGVAGA